MEKHTTTLTPENNDEKHTSAPVAVGKVAARRVLGYMRNKHEGLPAGYVRNAETAHVMALAEDEMRSAAVRSRGIAQTRRETPNPNRGLIDNHIIGLTQLDTETRDALAAKLHETDEENYEATIRMHDDMAKTHDKAADSDGKTARRHYEIAVAKGDTYQADAIVDRYKSQKHSGI